MKKKKLTSLKYIDSLINSEMITLMDNKKYRRENPRYVIQGLMKHFKY